MTRLEDVKKTDTELEIEKIHKRINRLQWTIVGDIFIIILMLCIIAYLIQS